MQELHASIRSQLAVQAADLRVLAHRLTSGPEADDCVQNTVITALAQREPPRNLRPWLRRVLRNEINAHHRLGHRRQRRERVSPAPEPTPGLDERAELGQMITALRAILDDLDEPYRTTLRRRFLLEHPAARIAEDEGCAPTTVRWRVHEGLRRMRRMLDERFDGRPQWRGGVAMLASWPVDDVSPDYGEGAEPIMNTPIIATKTLSLLTTVGLTGAVAAVAALAGRHVDATVPTPSARAEAPVAAGASASSAQASLHRWNEAEPDALALAPEPATDEARADLPLVVGGDDTAANPWLEQLRDCLDASGVEPDGKRFEVEVQLVGTALGEPPEFESIAVTTGRPVPCMDPVEEVAPLDAEGVVHWAEVSACMVATADPASLRDSMSAGERQQYVMSFIDGPGDGPEDSAAAEPPLPAPDTALADTDPEHAPAALGLPARGGDDVADPINVVECIDYDCPFCRRAQADLAELRATRPRARVHVLHNPLAMHPSAPRAARAAEAANEQGRFWEMHDALMANPTLRSMPELRALAVQLGLDVERFEADLISESIGQRVATMAAICQGAGARGTPSVFVGGDLVTGAQGYEALAEALEFEASTR